MALRPDEFYDHAIAAADADHRLPLARMTGWEISPFEQDGLRVSSLRPPVLPEKARAGEHWRLARVSGVGVPLVLMLYPNDHHDLPDLPDELAAELGVLTTHLTRHIEALPNIARAHVYRIGDGGAHLHVWFFGRPEGQSQLYGSWMVIWDDLLPEYPADVADADARLVAAALIDSYGGSTTPTSPT
jgi:hypothetical protein